MITGSIVAMVTPMHEGGAIDTAALRRLVDFHVDNGTSAIVAVGTTGESATLDHDEHIDVIEAVVQAAAGRLPVIGGTGANSTTEALSLTRRAKEVGVEACLLVTPYYNKPTQDGLFQHHKLISETVDIPQILYNEASQEHGQCTNRHDERTRHPHLACLGLWAPSWQQAIAKVNHQRGGNRMHTGINTRHRGCHQSRDQ